MQQSTDRVNIRVDILHTPIDPITRVAARTRLQQAVDNEAATGRRGLMVVTPNPEIVLQAHRDADYRAVLQRADLAVPDGVGLGLFINRPERVTGVDLAGDVLALLTARPTLRLACIVRSDGRSTVDQVKAAVAERAAGVQVVVLAAAKTKTIDSRILQQLQQLQPTVVLVGLGFPDQEYWLDQALDQVPSLRLGLAVGGTFDFWTGAARRAPGWLQHLGLEWLYRLVREPRRLGRIWQAVVVFPLTVAWVRLLK